MFSPDCFKKEASNYEQIVGFKKIINDCREFGSAYKNNLATRKRKLIYCGNSVNKGYDRANKDSPYKDDIRYTWARFGYDARKLGLNKKEIYDAFVYGFYFKNKEV